MIYIFLILIFCNKSFCSASHSDEDPSLVLNTAKPSPAISSFYSADFSTVMERYVVKGDASEGDVPLTETPEEYRKKVEQARRSAAIINSVKKR